MEEVLLICDVNLETKKLSVLNTDRNIVIDFKNNLRFEESIKRLLGYYNDSNAIEIKIKSFDKTFTLYCKDKVCAVVEKGFDYTIRGARKYFKHRKIEGDELDRFKKSYKSYRTWKRICESFFK